MTSKQKEQFNRMLRALRTIAKGYQSPDQLRRNARKQFGLDYEDALEMAYDNIQGTARSCIRGVKEIRS